MTGSYAYQEILFFDTFLHEKADALNLDHVKFKFPVYIDEIRVIPKSCDINVSSHHINGQTSPMVFKLEIYGNNLNKGLNDLGTFDKIGNLSYKYDEENVIKPTSIPTDWLAIKGPYTALTIVVIGVKAKQSDGRDAQHRLDNSLSTPTTPITPRLSAGLLPTPITTNNIFQSPVQYNQNQYSNGAHDHGAYRQPEQYVRFISNDYQHNVARVQHQQQVRSTFVNENTCLPFNQPTQQQVLNTATQQQQQQQESYRQAKQQKLETEDTSVKKPSEDSSNVDMKLENNNNTSVSEAAENNTGDLNLNGSNMAVNDDVDDELDDLQLYYSQIGLDDEYPCDYNELASYSINSFNPYQLEIPPKLSKIPNPTQNSYEQLLAANIKQHESKLLTEKLLFQQLLDLLPSEASASRKSQEHNSETWLQQCEKLFATKNLVVSLVELKQTNEAAFNKLIDYLIDLTNELLNYKNLIKTNKFKEQTKQMFKIRQIKFSLTLVSLLASQLDEEISKKLLQKQVQIKLMQLFENESIYMSLKVAILKALDSTLCFPAGIQEFLGGESDISEDSTAAAAATTTKATKTAYTRLLTFLIGKKCTLPSRVNNHVGKLLSKLMLFNLLNRFQTKVSSLISLNAEINLATSSIVDQFTAEHYKLVNELYDLFALFYFLWRNQHKQFSQDENIIKKLPIKILFVNQMLTSEQESFMIQRLFGHCDSNDACYTFFYRLINHHNTLRSLILLWSHPILTQIRVDFLQMIEKFFNDMLYSSESLHYLLVNAKLSTTLVKLMLKKTPTALQANASATNLDEILQATGNSSLASQLAYSLQTLIYINNLNELWSQSELKATQKFDFYLQNLNIIQSMSMFLTSMNTKATLTNVFTLSNNISVLTNLLKFIHENPSDENSNENQLKKLLINSIVEIIGAVLKHNDNNMNFFKNHSLEIHKVISLYLSKDEQYSVVQMLGLKSMQDKLKQLNEYLAPQIKLKSYSYECIGYLMKNLKLFATEPLSRDSNNESAESSTSLNAILSSKTLIQILRLMKYLCVQPNDSEQTTADSQKYEILSEFNFKRCLGELLSQPNCLDDLLYFVKKLSDYILYTYQNSVVLSLNEKHQIFTVLKLCLQLTHEILRTHVDTRKNKFNNTACLKSLFNLFNSIHLTFQLDQIYEDVLNSIKASILNTLMLFMQQEKASVEADTETTTETDEKLYNNNLYKCLFRELCKFIIERPCNFIGGLVIFVELLPLPLPIICKYEENNQKLTDTIKSERLLLDFNLNLVLPQLRAVIRALAVTANMQLQHIFKRFCVNLADISANMCVFVLKSVLDEIIEQIQSKTSTTVCEPQMNEGQLQMEMTPDESNNLKLLTPQSVEDNSPIGFNFLWPIDVARLVTFITSLISNSANSSVKHGFLFLIKPQKQQGYEKYRSLLSSMINYCINATRLSTDSSSEEIQHLLIQESIFYLVQVLCDSSTLYEETMAKQQPHHLNLFRQWPDYELLKQIVRLLIDHVHSTRLQTIQITSAVLNALILLCRHDYGYEIVVSVLNNHSNTIYNFLNEFNLILMNRQQSLYDLVSLLAVFNEFIRLLVPPVIPPALQTSSSLPNLASMETEDGTEKQVASTRTSHMSQKKFREIIKWNSNTKDHPLLKLVILLENLIKTSITDASTQLIELQNDANSLISHLRSTDAPQSANENEKFLFLNSLNNYKFIDKLPDDVVFVDADSLEKYYSQRLVYLVDDNINGYFDIERYINEWTNSVYENGAYDDVIDLSTAGGATPTVVPPLTPGSNNSSSTSVNQSPLINADQQLNTSSVSSIDNLQFDKIEIDLEEIIKAYCPNFDLNCELTKEFGDVIGDKQTIATKSTIQPEVINTRTGFRYKAPMRGGHNPGMRGSAAFNPYLGYRTDPFRSRQPNTSRPPSVHVDDFYRQQELAKINNSGGHLMSHQPESIEDDWQRSQRQFHQQPQFVRAAMNVNNGTIQANSSFNSRSRFIMPPGTYSVNNTQLRDRMMQGEFLSPLPPPMQPNTQQMMQQNQRFHRMPMQLDRRNSYPNLEQSDEQHPMMNSRQSLGPPQQFNAQLRFSQFPNNPLMRPGFRSPTNYIQRHMPAGAYMRTSFPR